MKEEVIVIRIDEEFKESLKIKAESLGLSLSSYVRMTLKKSLQDV